MDARVDALNQGLLPDQALNLPGAQRNEEAKEKDRTHGPNQQTRWQAVGAALILARVAIRAQGVPWVGALGCMGIMLVFMWNITHKVPAMAMATNTTVKMVDSMVQPP